MQKLRNLPHIAAMAFNEPLLIEPAYARVFFCALAGQMGISNVSDPTAGLLQGEGMHEALVRFGEDEPRMRRSYQLSDGIAVIPVAGTLVSKASYLTTLSGMTGYSQIISQMTQALGDPEVKGILLDMDTPGGMVAGAFDCADMIARFRDIKPVWALANDMNCSAGQLIASAASRRLVTQTAKTGSIGVLMAHSNYATALENEGVDITLIHSGAHKTDGNPYEKLRPEVLEQFQARMDATRQMFAEKVALYSGLSVDAILATEAQVYAGAEALDVGLAQELVINADAIGLMAETLNIKNKTFTGGSMTTMTTATDAPGSEGQGAPVGNMLTQADIKAAVRDENARITGILGCEEAKGREGLARELASTPGMSLADAQRIMAASSLSAQARSETALDTLMADSPQAARQSADNGRERCDLLDIPV
ncbi:S49 family peptidase [Enterobacter roggenkampii]|uniref:S49 family peptidase n=1 Tax=Enterobacter roggenkampii TaxID=1812935 RepID=UPI002238B2CE|nr:S49 family peptidase [Enterobacter roggenkampii]MCW5003527.1 S49 family peptidase [Enterobacter roggenkampii]